MQPLTRRGLLRAAVATGGLLVWSHAHAARARQPGRPLELAWWGEDEAPGLRRWMDDTVARFTVETGIPVSSSLLASEDVAEGFSRLAETGAPVPDVQFQWNGIFVMQNVWRNFLLPLNGLVSHSILKRSGATGHSVFEGKQFRAGFYSFGFGVAYNKRLLERAGLNADDPPLTWDAFLNACDRLRAAGIVPLIGGVSDGYWGDWFLINSLPQQLDSGAEALQLFIGNLDWREPRYHEHWVRLEELKKRNFLNADMSSLGLYPGIDLIVAGKLAMGESIGSRIPADSKKMSGRIGCMVMPVFGKGKMAGKPILDAQGIGISAKAEDPKAAAAFLEFLQSPERLNALWEKTGWIPTSSKFDTSVIKDEVVRSMWRRWGEGETIPYIANVVPGQFYEQALLPTAQQIVAGKSTGEEAGALASKIAEEWRNFNPDMVDRYKEWAKDLSA